MAIDRLNFDIYSFIEKTFAYNKIGIHLQRRYMAHINYMKKKISKDIDDINSNFEPIHDLILYRNNHLRVKFHKEFECVEMGRFPNLEHDANVKDGKSRLHWVELWDTNEPHGKRSERRSPFLSGLYLILYVQMFTEEISNYKPIEIVDNPIKWNGSKWQFSELVKALKLTGMFNDSESAALKKLAPLFEFKERNGNVSSFDIGRHSTNLNEMVNDKPADSRLTNKLSKAISDFVASKY